MRKRNDVFYWALGAISGAMFFVLCVVFAPISYGAIQFRVASLVSMLGIVDWRVAIGVSLGVILSNLYGGLGMLDVLMAVCAGFFIYGIPLAVASYFKRKGIKINPWWIYGIFQLTTFIWLAVAVATLLSNILNVPWLFMVINLELGSSLVPLVVGIPIFMFLLRGKYFSWQTK
jgi:uncharacterized membrane protein